MKKSLRLLLAVLLSSFYYFSNAQTPNWTNLGPIPFPVKTIGQVHGIGRCSQIKFHPTNANKMYVASASGGLYYSANKGVSWSILGTDNITKVQSASIAIDPTNDQIIYWGTGDANYYSSGQGVYKTTNGGSTWTLSNTGMGNRLVIEMIIDPANTQNILAATNNGIYKSTDGGANWTLKSTSGLQFQDMVLKPSAGTQTVYACTKSALYISNDWGNTWSTTGTGLVMDGSGARIAVSAANASIVYVGITKAYGAIFKSTDGGANFSSMRTETTQNLTAYNATDTDGGQGNYNFDIGANPADANELYLCSHTVWRTLDGGGTWSHQQTSWASNLHTDEHQILFDPYVSGQIWNANDGGVWSNTANGTGAWAPMSDGIAATEIYHAAICKTNRQLFYIGTQDNGGFYYQSGTWYNDKGGDWGPGHWFDYSSNYVYFDETPDRNPIPTGSNNALNFPFTASNSNRSLYAFTPANTNIAYVANANNVYRCSNLTSSTPSWTLIYTVPSGTIKDIQVEAGNADEVYILSNTPQLFRSDNATTTASFIQLTTPNTTTSGSIAPIPNSNVVFIGQGSSIYRSADQGATWTATTGFPSASIKKVVADPKSTIEAVYACYNLGVYYKDNTLSSWANYSSGLPIIAGITDMDIYNDGISQGAVNIYYYGRGTWQSPLVMPPSTITVALTSPANNSVYNGPANITLTATASTTSGSISKVEFYNGTTLLSTSTSSPYTYSWNNVIAGTYGLTAVAYDNLGNKKSSSLINITVKFVCNQLTGTAFGTTPYFSPGTNTFDLAFDGNVNSYFDASSPSAGYTGLDLGTAKVITGIRFYPRSGNAGRMVGGKFQGSNVANFSSGVVDLYVINATPVGVWNEVSVTDLTPYRYVRFLSGTNGYCNIAELQFCGQNNIPPTVSITAPANNALYPSVPATVNITASASDADGTINKVEFYKGATLIGTSTTSPYAYSWTGVAAGTYQLTAKAYDNQGATATSTIITIIVGNQSPTVAITSPANNSTFAQAANITINATANDPDGTISKVEFYNGATLLGTDNTSPHTYTWNGVGAGTYALTAKAYDNTTGVAISSVVNITVTNQNPTVSITSPANNATYTAPASVTITASASDADGTISKVEFYNGAILLGTSTTSPYSFSWTNVLTGTYSLTAKAYDNNNGTTTSSVITILVGNQPPVVLLTTPANATTYTAPASVVMNALASDPDGSITKVEFYNGATLLGSSIGPNFTYTWGSVAIGTYSITAKAYDNGGSTTTSAAASITVNNGCTAPAWSAATTYVGDASLGAGNGEVVSYNGRQYRAMFWSQGTSYQPDTHNGSGQAWTDLGACAASNVAPSVGITSPANNATFSPGANITITASASDADGTIASVKFYQGTTLLGTVTTNPYTYTWNSVAAGNYQLSAVATDNKGTTATSTIVTIIVGGNQSPTISITAPANNAVFSTSPATVSITANAADPDGTVTKVEFYNGATLLGTATTSPFTYNWTNVASGTYTLTAKAYDNNSAVTTSTAITIRVNASPIVVITAPANNAVYTTAPATVNLTATATDADGTISKVEFYNGATLLGTSTTIPYSYNWTGLAVGTYTLTAKAYDNNGAITTSSIISIRVNQAPTVSITVPVNNTVYNLAPATVAITSAASDADGNISKVEFYNGATLLGTSTTSPYTYSWTNVAAGTYSLTAKAYDNDGATTTSATISIRVNASPTVAITAPANNTVYSSSPATVAFTATASDADGSVTKVEFYNGTTLIGTVTAGPFTYNWTGVTNGNYTITAKAYDNNGAITTSSAITITVNQSPTISVTAPANNAVYVTAPATVNVLATAADADGTISKVEFYNGATLLGTSTTSPYTYNWTNVAVGTYSLTAKAYDNNGAITTSSAINIRVNAAPIVSITAPANNSSYIAPASISITASATDADGTISKVEFYDGSTLLGTSTTNPYTYNWTSVTAGNYTITAKAYDNNGAVTTSGAIIVVVNNNSAPTVSITSPVNNTVVSPAPGTINIVAAAADADGTISKVEFYNGATLLGSSTSSPYSYNWVNVPAGTYTLTAKAYDNLGATTVSSAITVIVNAAPTVSITAPVNNTTYTAPAAVNITASATDADGTISKVEFYNGATLIGTATASPYIYSWTSVAAGSYTLTAKAYDNRGAITTSSVISITVNTPANQSPIVSITSPINNAVQMQGSSIVINATASDPDGTIAKVEFYSGATLLGTDNTTPYSFTISNATPGTYTLTAKAYDNNSATANSTVITVVVKTTPTITITGPTNNGVIKANSPFTISTSTNDPDGAISKVEYYIGTTLLGTSTSQPYTYNGTAPSSGSYTIMVKAYDVNGNVIATNSITIVSNIDPVVNITSPANNTTYSAGASVNIKATATDADGTISKVEFYNGATLLGTSTTSPYSFNWTNTSAGTYSITAKAYDNSNVAGISAPINVIVNANAAPAVSITSPANNSSFIASASITINATASDADGTISKVEFYNGVTLLGTSTSSPYTYNWTGVTAGSYSLTAKAYDNLGAVTTSSIVAVNVNSNAAPVVSITSPLNNATFTAPATITFTASASDADGTISKVEFYNGATLIGTSTSNPYTTAVSNVAAGTYTITAKAYDNLGAVTVSSSVIIIVNGCAYAAWSASTIYVAPNRCERNGNVYEAKWWTQNNDPLTNSNTYDVWKYLGPCGSDLMPSMVLSSTASGTTMPSPASFTIDVTSHDDEGSVTKVEFYSGTTLMNQIMNGNGSYNFNGLSNGTYQIYVKVYDNAGNVAVSDTLKYTVQSATTINNTASFGRLNMYPNPVTGNDVTFDYPVTSNGKIYISIVDVNGKEWYKVNEDDGNGMQKTINVDFLPPGAYIVKLRIAGKEYHEKLVKPSRPKIK